MERSHRIDAEEFWRKFDDDNFDLATEALAQWAYRYNHERFSMALGGRTPMEKLAAIRGQPLPSFLMVNCSGVQ